MSVICLDKARRARAPGFDGAVIWDTEDGPFEPHGFEQGLLWGRLAAQPPEWRGTYRTANLRIHRKIAAHHGYQVELEPTEDPTWCFLTFTPMSRDR